MAVYREDPHWLPAGITRTLTLHDNADAVGFEGKVISTAATRGGGGDVFAEVVVYVPGEDVRKLIAELTEIADRRGL